MEPCLFTWRNNVKFLVLLLCVDDMLIASNDAVKLKQLKANLMREFEMTYLGEPREFLGFKIRRDREKQVLKVNQNSYIEKILKRFGFTEMHPQNTPIVTDQVINRKRKQREEDCDKARYTLCSKCIKQALD